MSTFRTCWRVLFAQRTMILVYIVYLSPMMFGAVLEHHPEPFEHRQLHHL